MKIKKSLQGDCHDAELWYCMSCKFQIEDMGFMCSEMDPCPFIKNNCIVVLHINDTINFSKDDAEIERVLQQFCDLQYDFQTTR